MLKKILAAAVVLGTIAGTPAYAATAVPVDRTVAVANNDIILESELAKASSNLKRNLLRMGQELPPDDIIRKNALERLIVNSLIMQLAEKNGITMTDSDIDRAISHMAAMNHTTVSAMLAQAAKEGFSEADYRNEVRNNVIIGEVTRSQVRSRINISDQEVEQLALMLKDNASAMSSYHLGLIFVKLDPDASPAVTDAANRKMKQIKDELSKGKVFANVAARFSEAPTAVNGGDLGTIPESQLPPYIADAVRDRKKGDLVGPFRTEEGLNLVKIYDVGSMTPEPVEQVKVKHILLKTSIIFDDKAAEARLAGFRSEIENGDKTFDELARSYSEDYSNSFDGGLMDWMNPEVFDPAFRDAIALLKPGEISRPFKSSFGWHLAELVGRKVDRDSLEAYKVKAREILFNRSINEESERWQREIRDSSYVKIYE